MKFAISFEALLSLALLQSSNSLIGAASFDAGVGIKLEHSASSSLTTRRFLQTEAPVSEAPAVSPSSLPVASPEVIAFCTADLIDPSNFAGCFQACVTAFCCSAKDETNCMGTDASACATYSPCLALEDGCGFTIIESGEQFLVPENGAVPGMGADRCGPMEDWPFYCDKAEEDFIRRPYCAWEDEEGNLFCAREGETTPEFVDAVGRTKKCTCGNYNEFDDDTDCEIIKDVISCRVQINVNKCDDLIQENMDNIPADCSGKCVTFLDGAFEKCDAGDSFSSGVVVAGCGFEGEGNPDLLAEDNESGDQGDIEDIESAANCLRGHMLLSFVVGALTAMVF